MINTIFFDLDGTLLLMDQDEFLEQYFKSLGRSFSNYGDNIIKAVEAGVYTMLKNNGKFTNEEVFWKTFNTILPLEENLEAEFQNFYENDFQRLKEYTQLQKNAKKAIDVLKQKGYDLVLCTNPLFPQIATHSRIKWSGLNVDDFSYVTTFENSSYCKPNIKYYEEVLNKLNKTTSQVMMVGNDVLEDLCVSQLNIKTFLVEDNLINRNSLTITSDYRGMFSDFYEFVLKLPER